MAAANKKSRQPLFFFEFVYKRALEMLVFSSFSIETASAALVRAFWQPSSSSTLWAGLRILIKRRLYGLPHAMYVAMFHCTFCKTLVRAIRVHFGSYLHDFTGWRLQICRSRSSKVVVGNGGLNSKSVVSALCLVLSWKAIRYKLK